MWERPEEVARRGESYLILNAVPIRSFIGNKKAFKEEVKAALKN
ncbi:MAG: hypothetical protein ACLFVP_01560 [Candidatus Bathyarchaeia archaeon]